MATQTIDRIRWELDSLASFHTLSGSGIERYDAILNETDHLLQIPRRIKEVTPYTTLPQLFFNFGDTYSAYKWTQRFLRESWGKVSREGWLDVVRRHVIYASEIGRMAESEFFIQEALHVLPADSFDRYELLVQSGKNALKQGDPTRSASRLHGALSLADNLDVDRFPALVALSKAYLDAGEPDRALDTTTFLYSRTMPVEREREVQVLLVETFSRLGRWEKARGIISRVEKDKFAEGNLFLALLKYHVGLGERGRAVGDIDEAIERGVLFSQQEITILMDLVIQVIQEARGGQSTPEFFLQTPFGKNITDLLEKIIDSHDRYNKAGHGTRSHHTVKRVLAVLERSDNEEIAFATRLHDLGKIFLPESLLNRLQDLDEEDRGILVDHAARGYDLFTRLEWTQVAHHVLRHHERVDGKGYPCAVTNPNLVDNLIFLCSSFDSMVNPGPMRTSFLPYEDGVALIKEESGKAYNPLLSKPFLSVIL